MFAVVAVNPSRGGGPKESLGLAAVVPWLAGGYLFVSAKSTGVCRIHICTIMGNHINTGSLCVYPNIVTKRNLR